MRPATGALLVLGAVALTGCASGDPNDRASPKPRATTTVAPTTTAATMPEPASTQLEEFDVPPGSAPHDVAVAADGTVWYTAQGSGELGRLDPATGEITEVALGAGSRPHGVIVGADEAAWVTDSGLNAVVRVSKSMAETTVFPLPSTHPSANLNTAVFDADGTLWFTGQSGVYGRLTPETGRVEAFDSPDGPGPYGITATPSGDVYYASLAGSHVGRIDTATGEVTVLRPPTRGQGTRRVWADSGGRVWASQWNAGQVAVYDPATDGWREWRLPGERPQAYAVYVDERDDVWLSDFGANTLVRFDPRTEEFVSYALPSDPGDIRQIHGRSGEVWGAESAADKLVVLRH